MTLTAKWPRDHNVAKQYYSDMAGKVKIMRLPSQACRRGRGCPNWVPLSGLSHKTVGRGNQKFPGQKAGGGGILTAHNFLTT
jgi:hypothetical protein